MSRELYEALLKMALDLNRCVDKAIAELEAIKADDHVRLEQPEKLAA